MKFIMKNRRQSNSVLSDTELFFPCFPTKFEIRLIHFNSEGNDWEVHRSLGFEISDLTSCFFGFEKFVVKNFGKNVLMVSTFFEQRFRGLFGSSVLNIWTLLCPALNVTGVFRI